MKKFNYSKLSLLILSGLLYGCGSGGGSGGDNVPIDGSATIVKSLPQNLMEGQVGTLEATVSNGSQNQTMYAVGASCPTVQVTGVRHVGELEGQVNIDFSGGATTVGAGEACWNGSTGATLACGQTCTQDIKVSGVSGAHIGGKFELILSGSGQTKTLSTATQNTTIVGFGATSDNYLALNVQPEWGPNQTVIYEISNITSKDLDDLYIDLTDLKENFPEIFNAIDFDTLQGGTFDPETNRINIDTILAGETIEISFFVDGSSKDAFADGNTVSKFVNDGGGVRISVDDMAPMSEDKTQAKVNPLPFVASDNTVTVDKQGTVIIQNLDNAGMEVSKPPIYDLPEGVTVSGCAEGTQLSAGESCTLVFDVAPDATGGTGTVTITLEDENGVEYTQTITVTIDTTTILYNNETIIAQRAYIGGPAKITDVKVINAGAFDYTMPADLTQVFNITGPSADRLSIVPSTQTPSCVNFTLTPQRENPYFSNACYIAIQSNNSSATLGNYKINTIALNNVKSGVLAAFNLQASYEGLDAIMTNLLPLRINTDKTGLFTVNFTNTGDTPLTINTITIPTVTGATLTLKTGEGMCATGTEIAVGESCTLSYEATGDAGDAIQGNFSVVFNTGRDPITWTSMNINSEFHESIDLPVQTFRVISTPNFQPGDMVNILVRNDNIRNLQSLTLDLSTMDNDLFDEIDSSTFQGGDYDGTAKTVTMETDLLAGQTHLFQFKLNKSATNPLSNATILNAISDNPDSGYITLTAVNAQDLQPSLHVQNTPLTFSKNAITVDKVGHYPIEIKNTSNDDYTVAVADLPTGVTATGCDTLPAGGVCTLMLTVDQTASSADSGDFEITLTHDGNNQDIAFPITIQGVKLARANERALALYRKLDGSDDPTVDVVLKNIGGFDLQAGLALADMFEIRDSNDDIPTGFAFENGSISCESGVATGRQCILTIKSTEDDTALGAYEVFTKSTGNLIASTQPIASFELYDAIDGFEPETLSSLPANLITGEEAIYTAILRNESDEIYHLNDVRLPTGGVFVSDVPAANGNCWNGTDVGVTLEHGEQCVLSFTLTGGAAGGEFKGDLTLNILNEQSGGDFDLRTATFDTTYVAADDVSVQANATVDDATTLFAPNTLAHKQINNPTVALNNAVLDLTGLNSALYEQILYVKVGNREVSLPNEGQIVRLGSLAVGSHRLDIKFDGTAGAALEVQKDDLENNLTTHLVAIKAANQVPIYPNITVSITPVEVEEDLIISDNNPHAVSFTNISDVAVTIVDIKPSLPIGVTVTDAGTCAAGQTIQPKGSCQATITAGQTAYGKGSARLDYTDGENTFFNTLQVIVEGVTPQFTTANPIVTKVQNAGESVTTNIQINAISSPFNWRLPTNLSSMFVLAGDNDPSANGLSIVNPVNLLADQKSCASGEILSGDSCWIGIRSAFVDAEQTSYSVKTVADPIDAVNVQPNITVGQFTLTARANVIATVDDSWNQYLRTKRIMVYNGGEVDLDDLAWTPDSGFTDNFELYDGTNGGLWCNDGVCPERCEVGTPVSPDESCYIYVRGKDNVAVGGETTGALTLTGNHDQSKTFNFTNNAYLYAGGFFRFSSEPNMLNIARYDGENWTPLGQGLNASVEGIAISDRGEMLIVGNFTASGDTSINRIATWNAQEMKQFGTGLPDTVSSVAFSRDQQKVYFGGLFDQHFLVWDGSGFSQLANSSPDGASYAIFEDVDGTIYMGGYFYSVTTPQGAMPAGDIASYNPTDGWVDVGQDLFAETAAPYDIKRIGDRIVFGGDFEPDNLFDPEGQYFAIAKWDPVTQTTSQFGDTGGASGHLSDQSPAQIYQIVPLGGDDFIAVGNVAKINGQDVNNIIRWDSDTNQWISLITDADFFDYGFPMTFVIDAGNNVYLGGSFVQGDRRGAAKTTLNDIQGDWVRIGEDENDTTTVRHMVISYEVTAEAE